VSRLALVMAGGTGGHIFPGIAVAQALRARGWDVVWLGTPGSMESEIVPRHGFAFEAIQARGLRGKGWATLLVAPLHLLRAFGQALRVMRRLRPDVAVGMGGYAAFPGGMMSAIAGIPLVLHEQNAIAGWTNRLLAPIADRVFAAFPGSIGKAEWCGNPLRAGFAALDPPQERYALRTGPLRLLVLGGSLGAKALNELVPDAVARMAPAQRPQIVHQSGAAHIEALRSRYAAAQVQAECVPFIDDMPAAYQQADLVICRAGAMTVSEVAAVGVAALFVPFPHAVDDHQTANARFLADQGAAVLMQQAELSAEKLAAWLLGQTRAQLAQMAQQARLLARTDAAARVADACEQLTVKKA
jgi:UDP-N-acetylglucosamine--N-acetylmuramyl-(pentapeptide) pyrophosphoryl-undecaprenol N-acetylglucosamine transferase